MISSAVFLCDLIMRKTITDVPGISVGHYTDDNAGTGCTVILCGDGAVGGVDVRGSAPGTRETDLLKPGNLVREVHAVLLSGGSAFGLDAAGGVMAYLEEKKIGFPAGKNIVPIVPAAILFDLGVATCGVRPGYKEGYQACLNASNEQQEQGSIGAGTGATVGKMMGMGAAVKSGIGMASLDLGNGVVIGAIAAVNAVGSIHDPRSGDIVAGPRREDGMGFRDSVEIALAKDQDGVASDEKEFNTTLAVVATNAAISKEQANKLASIAHDGFALAIRPTHTMADGDVVFAVGTGIGSPPFEFQKLLTACVQITAEAIVNAVKFATEVKGIPSIKELAR